MVYFLVINLAPYVLNLNDFKLMQSTNDSGDIQSDGINIGFSDSVSASFVKHRFYGTIYGSGEESKLKLFNLVKVPLKKNGINYAYIHFIFLLGILVSILIIALRSTKENFINPKSLYS